MAEQQIHPEKVTKPIQLLAAWLVGLIVVNASFLLGAQQITRPDWGSAVLVVAAVANVPVFLCALFLLQTKFRPQMQEDSYYAKYLEREGYQAFSTSIRPSELAEQEVAQTTERLAKDLGLYSRQQREQIAEVLRDSQKDLLLHKHGGNRTLSQLFLVPDEWPMLVQKYGMNPSFIRDMEGMVADGLVECKDGDNLSARLTDLGLEIAQRAQRENMLFSQKKPEFWMKRHKQYVKESESNT